jgi:hypothetical protein
MDSLIGQAHLKVMHTGKRYGLNEEHLYEQYKLIYMNRYEYFEKWMTTEEWKEFKRQFPSRYRQSISNCSIRQARARRTDYLMQEVNFPSSQIAINDFENMTNMYIRWVDTPQGHTYWSQLNNRTGPIR